MRYSIIFLLAVAATCIAYSHGCNDFFTNIARARINGILSRYPQLLDEIKNGQLGPNRGNLNNNGNRGNGQGMNGNGGTNGNGNGGSNGGTNGGTNGGADANTNGNTNGNADGGQIDANTNGNTA